MSLGYIKNLVSDLVLDTRSLKSIFEYLKFWPVKIENATNCMYCGISFQQLVLQQNIASVCEIEISAHLSNTFCEKFLILWDKCIPSQ